MRGTRTRYVHILARPPPGSTKNRARPLPQCAFVPGFSSFSEIVTSAIRRSALIPAPVAKLANAIDLGSISEKSLSGFEARREQFSALASNCRNPILPSRPKGRYESPAKMVV